MLIKLLFLYRQVFKQVRAFEMSVSLTVLTPGIFHVLLLFLSFKKLQYLTGFIYYRNKVNMIISLSFIIFPHLTGELKFHGK